MADRQLLHAIKNRVEGKTFEIWEETTGLLAAYLNGTALPLQGSVPSFNGIKMPATQVQSADANTLDDYKEGTFTPTVVGTTTAGAGTYTQQAGSYTKIGNLVIFQATLTWTAHTGTGNMNIGGLPATSNNTANRIWAVDLSVNNLTLTAGNVAQGHIDPNTTIVALEQTPSGGGASAAIPIAASGTIVVSGAFTV